MFGGWLTATPSSGIIPGMSQAAVQLKYDVSQNEFQGRYQAQLLLTTSARPIAKVSKACSCHPPADPLLLTCFRHGRPSTLENVTFSEILSLSYFMVASPLPSSRGHAMQDQALSTAAVKLCITLCYMYCRHSQQQPTCSVPPFKACQRLEPTPLCLCNFKQSKTQSPLAWTGLQSLAMAATSTPRLPSGSSRLRKHLFHKR